MANVARTGVPPAIAALQNAPKGDPSLLTDEDRARIESNRRKGRKGVSHETVEAMLAERKRRAGG